MFWAVGAFAQSPGQVVVREVRAQGHGCPKGSVNGVIAPDGSSFALLMDDYRAEALGNKRNDRKNCVVHVTLDIPEGLQYSIVSADYRGFVEVDEGAVAVHQVKYSHDSAAGGFRATEFRGPASTDYSIRSEAELGSPKSPCSRGGQQKLQFVIFLIARLDRPHSPAIASIGLDSVDGAAQSQNFQLAWNRCNPSMR
jgi:hypothetical protein